MSLPAELEAPPRRQSCGPDELSACIAPLGPAGVAASDIRTIRLRRADLRGAVQYTVDGQVAGAGLSIRLGAAAGINWTATVRASTVGSSFRNT